MLPPRAAATDAAGARSLAHRLVEDLRTADDAALAPRGIDLGPAVEQVLFQALRDGSSLVAAPRHRLLRGLRAAGTALMPARPARRADVLVVHLAGVHARLFAPVADRLAEASAGVRVAEVTAGHAARHPGLAHLPTIARSPGFRDVPPLLATGIDPRRLRSITHGWVDVLGAEDGARARSIVEGAIARLGVEALRLDATLQAVRPRVAVTYDEVDAWGRLLCSVAARHDVRVVDLPHAEAVDVEAIRGAGYDAMGVFGPRAASVLGAAGVPADRIRVIGPAGFDALVGMAARPVDAPPRVVLAAQYPGRGMTAAVRTAILEAAVAAAAAIGGTVELIAHPTEEPDGWRTHLDALAPTDAPVRLLGPGTLHDRLPGAALLVTGWSNSVYEAVLAGVPAITVRPGPEPSPMPFADEGMATEARDAAGAGAAASTLVADPGRTAALERARPALAEHLGPLDGGAARRAAQLLLEMLER